MTDQSQTAPAGWYAEPGTGHTRWWDGANWGAYQQAPQQHTPAAYVPAYAAPAYAAPAAAVARNGFAIAALILGIWGFLTTAIPFFIGLFFGGIPDILAIVFGILGIVRARRFGGVGMAPAIIGLVLGGLAFLSIFLGAGTIW